MQLIQKPLWAREPDIYLDDYGAEEAYTAFKAVVSIVLEELHTRIEAFANDPKQTFSDDQNFFPTRLRLSGKYYLGDQSFSIVDQFDRSYYLMTIMIRCLQRSLDQTQEGTDYLGLDAEIFMARDTGEIVFGEGFNTSVI